MKPEKTLCFNQSQALAQPSRFTGASNFIQILQATENTMSGAGNNKSLISINF
jgi:hypothetical protein